MTRRSSVAGGLVAMTALAGAARLSAQERAFAGTVGAESGGIVASVAVATGTSRAGDVRWSAGLIGWTVLGEVVRVPGAGRSAGVRAELTPFNANSSNFVYDEGRPDTALAFVDRSIRLSALVRWAHSWRWSSEVRLTALREFVSETGDSVLEDAWRNPFLGLTARTAVQVVQSDDPLRQRWDGAKANAEAWGFTGSRTWWRARAFAGAGRKSGPLWLGGAVTGLTGDELDVVNRHLVGGSWDLPYGTPLPGYRFAAYRVADAAVAAARLDLRLAGTVEVGWRAGAMVASDARAWGQSLALTAEWNGVLFVLGAGLPEKDVFHGDLDRTFLFTVVNLVALP